MSTISGANMSLNTKIRSLPGELQAMILTALLMSLLQPGKIYPRGSEDANAATSPTRPEYINTLYGIPPYWWAKAYKMFFGTNTWVFPAGDWTPGAKFFLRLPRPVFPLVVSMELTLKWEDGQSYLEPGARVWFDLAARAGRGELLPPADLATYLALQTAIKPVVFHVWRQKLRAVRMLHLQHLRLDFSQTRDGTGVFRGWEVLYWGARPFTAGEPQHLEIVVPVGFSCEALIRRAIRGWNSNRLISAECSFCRDGLH